MIVKQKLLISILLFLALLGSVAYYAASRLTALMALRWLVTQTAVPLEIKSARWKATWSGLLQGHVDELEVDAKHAQTDLWIQLDSKNVNFKRNGTHWTIELSPLIQLNSFPQLKGDVTLELDSLTQAISSVFHLHLVPQGVISVSQIPGSLKIQKGELSGVLGYHPKQSQILGSLSLNGSGLHYEQSPNRAFEIKTIHITTSPLTIGLKPTITLESTVKINAKELQALWEGRFIEKKELLATATKAQIRFTESNQPPSVILGEVKFIKPYPLTAKVQYINDEVSGELLGHFDLTEVFQDLFQVFEDKIEVIKGLKVKGLATLTATAKKSQLTSAKLSAKLDQILLPSKNAEARTIELNMNLERGQLKIGNAGLGPWQTKNLNFEITKHNDGFHIQSVNTISIPLWSQKLVVNGFKLTILPDGTVQGDGALEGGPFPIGAIQKDFCFSADNPLPGFISFAYPRIHYDGQSLLAVGRVDGSVFNGRIYLGDVQIITDTNPKLGVTGALTGIDLAPVGDWLKFGKISGNLDVIFRDATLTLTTLGPVPMDYDFTIKGSNTEDRNLHFSAEALDNLMDMMGVKEATSGNPVAAIAMSAWRLIGNTFPFLNNLDYFGFRAKTRVGYTSLTTFDPIDSKNHYLIRGNSFKMPIKSSSGKDVYPVIMRTEEFQGWLWGRVAWFKTRSKEKAHDKHDGSNCTPVW